MSKSSIEFNVLFDCISEPPVRASRQYFLKTFGEPKERAWVAERSTHIFVGGDQFNNLPFVKGTGRQKDENRRYSVISESHVKFHLRVYFGTYKPPVKLLLYCYFADTQTFSQLLEC